MHKGATMNLFDNLRELYLEAQFEVEDNENDITFIKTYSFTDNDGTSKEVEIEVKYSKEFPLLPPVITDRKAVLHSMHSLYGHQCWARFSEIYQQTGLSIVASALVEQQIQKLIQAHIKGEYFTINESPEFTYAFSSRDLIDHSRFFLSVEVLDKVVEIGQGKIIRGLVQFNNIAKAYQVVDLPLEINPSLPLVFDDKPRGKNIQAYYLNVGVVPHFDVITDVTTFLYTLERLSGVKQEDFYLQRIEDEIFVIAVFYNKDLGHHDAVVFRKNKSKITLLPHARVSTRQVLFSRHKNEAFCLNDKKIALFGLGAIGSILGMNLLQSGVDNLIVVDPDYVDLENTSRSIYGEYDIGMKKTDAFMKHAMLKDADFGDRVVVCKDLKEVISENPDLIVICIGFLYEEYRMSRMLRKLDMDKVVFVFGQNDCTWAGIYFQDSADVGCQECLFLNQRENEELQIPYVAHFSEAVGCGGPSYISSPSDIGMIANLATKLIIERVIYSRKNSPNYFIWRSNPEPLAWRDCHTEPFSLKKYRVKRHAECNCQHIS